MQMSRLNRAASVLFGFLVPSVVTIASSPSGREPILCRERIGVGLEDSLYRLTTCAMCYFYLIKEDPLYSVRPNNTGQIIPDSLCSKKANECIGPNILEDSTIDDVCESLTDEKCAQWKMCCTDAWECCVKQKSRARPEGENFCPQTWDGWGCWDYAKNGSVQYNACPKFLNPNAKAAKNCTPDGSWYVDPAVGLEKTDYSGCTPTSLKTYRLATLLSIILNSIGLLLLLPSIAIFLFFKTLRCQYRIRIHIQLFLSLFVSGVFILVFDVRIRWTMVDTQSDDVVTQYPDTCKALTILQRFGLISPFFWMLCEGYFLHRLLVKAFEPHKRLYGYYLFAWGVPVFVTVLYAVLRKSLADTKECWLTPTKGEHHGLEWILFSPTLFCLAVNLLFFLNIMRILLRQISRLPGEPNNYRRAIKATFVLIPLFGLQQFFQIYQPIRGQAGSRFYEIADAVVINSQGILISLIFCFFNGEVLSHLKGIWKRWKYQSSGRRKSVTSQTTSRRLSSSSINITGGFPSAASFQNLMKAASAIAEENIIVTSTCVSVEFPENGASDNSGKGNSANTSSSSRSNGPAGASNVFDNAVDNDDELNIQNGIKLRTLR